MARGEVFSIQKYKSDAGGIYSIRISGGSFAANAVPIAAAYTDKKVQVLVSGAGRKRLAGLHSRGIRVGLPTAAGATTYQSYTFIPIVDPATWAAFKEGDFITYDGGQWEILSLIQEA